MGSKSIVLGPFAKSFGNAAWSEVSHGIFVVDYASGGFGNFVGMHRHGRSIAAGRPIGADRATGNRAAGSASSAPVHSDAGDA
jgi:hypothetical protein